ncbi:hypothetical protein ACFQ5M_01800 [Agrilactobacillus yilanensis]|uniref:Uncharacterized protein n=1 Tax=Agrilactobacillus yilanensis TaxID=2485997 RepID=A0ABW4J5A4_9LACO|nr:hypothetical protein [Agrilactobacillus yilanensis]
MKKSITYRLAMLLISLLLSGICQALTISTKLGATIWSASSLNILGAIFQTNDLAFLNHFNGTTMLIMSCLVGLVNFKLSPEKDIGRFFRNLLFVVPFSYLIQFFVPFWQIVLPKLHAIVPNDITWIALMIILDIVGLTGIAFAVSLYQRANLILHPYDDLAFTLRFYYFKGNAVKAQIVSFAIPVVLTIIMVLLNQGHLISVGFGTVWAFFAQGPMTAFFDRYALPDFKHQALRRIAMHA